MPSPHEAALPNGTPDSHPKEHADSFREFEHAGWEASDVVASYDEHLSRLTRQSAGALLDAAGVRQGSRVLDVAAGAGYIAAAAAARGADAVGVDFSVKQVELARQRYPAARFDRGDAGALPYAAESFDAVVSGFGMCHFPDPDRALHEAFRVLRRGGRVAFTVWAAPERAVAIGAVYAAVRAHGTMDVGVPAGPNFFLFSEPAECARALASAGFASPTSREVPQVWRVADPDDLFDVIACATVRTAAVLRAQTASAREAIRAAVRDVVSSYAVGGWYEVPAPAVLAWATKP